MRALKFPTSLVIALLLVSLTAPTLAQRIGNITVRPTRTLVPGDVLTVIMTGTPGGSAEFEILNTNVRQSMTDMGGGLYQGKFTVPRNLKVSNGVVFVTLSKNGADDTSTASQRVTIQSGGGSQPPVSHPGGRNTRVTPVNGTTVTNLRPEIGAHFSGAGSNPRRRTNRNSIRFKIDGRDVTREMQEFSNAIVWNPRSDLSPGRHTVDMMVLDLSGNFIVNETWSFTVQGKRPSNTLKSMTLAPAAGSTTSKKRPRISATTKSGKLGFDENRILFRVDGQDVSRQAVFANNFGNYILWDPRSDLKPGTHKVEILLRNKSGDFVVDEHWSFKVQSSTPISSSKITLRPANNSTTKARRPLIEARFPTANVDSQRLRFKVDGRDVSHDARVFRSTVDWTPTSDLKPGKHTVSVIILERNTGNILVDEDWSFTVGSSNSQPPASSKLTLVPLNDAEVTSTQPTIGVTFPGTVDQRSRVDAKRIRFKVDGQDVSDDVALTRNKISYHPPKKLGQGRHIVDILVFDISGKKIVDRGWHFTIKPTGATPPVTNTGHKLAVTNIQDGMVLGSRFVVNGTGIPGSQVVVTGEYPKQDILSQLAGVMLHYRGRTTVANDGTFSVPLDAGNVRKGEPMTLTVSDTLQSPTVTVRTRKGNANQAQPQVSGGGNTGNPLPPSNTPLVFTVFPANGNVSANQKPRIGAKFNQRVSRAKLIVDGRDFTNKARFNGNEIFWDAYQLDAARHSATVMAWVNGNEQRRSWSFDISKPTVAPGANLTFTVFPADGSNSPTRRPRIGSQFSQKVSRAKLVIDGRDFTNKAVFNGNEIFWNAPYDLDASRHTVTVTGWHANGAQESKSWSFVIR